MPSLADRIALRLGSPNLVERLSRLPGSELQSLLMEVFAARTRAATPAAVLREAERKPLFAPDPDARAQLELDVAAFAAAADFDAVELSPLTPLASCAALSRTAQHNVLSALRSAEVVADPTVALALECARWRRAPLAGRPAWRAWRPVPPSHWHTSSQPSGSGSTPHGLTASAITMD